MRILRRLDLREYCCTQIVGELFLTTAETTTVKQRKVRVENAAMRRRQIIDATMRSIEERGLSGTTLATVAANAGISQGSTVFYFETKEQLFTETFRTLCEDYRALWIAIFDQDYEDPIRHIAEFLFADFTDKFGDGGRAALWFAFWGEAQTRPQIAEIAEEEAAKRSRHLSLLVKKAAGQMDKNNWTIDRFVKAVEALSDGLWLELHIVNNPKAQKDARETLATFIASVFPSHRKKVMQIARQI